MYIAAMFDSVRSRSRLNELELERGPVGNLVSEFPVGALLRTMLPSVSLSDEINARDGRSSGVVGIAFAIGVVATEEMIMVQ